MELTMVGMRDFALANPEVKAITLDGNSYCALFVNIQQYLGYGTGSGAEYDRKIYIHNMEICCAKPEYPPLPDGIVAAC